MADLRTRIELALGTGHRIERELGGGGMSRVFLAEETALGRRVVVKVLPPEMAATVNAERFQREIRTVASLHHPNIVALISAGGADDLLWFTMPFVEGESLRARLTREGELPIGDAVRIWGEMLDALAYAHSRGVIHRDIKPENVLLSGRHALVADFGVSKALASATGDRSATVTGLALGTPAYMAPEQAAGDPGADHRADIYAAGLVMYEMLTGRSPFADRTPTQQMAAHAMVPAPPIRERREQVSPALESLVMQCLAKRPADRPQGAEGLLAALGGVPDVTPGTATTRGAMVTSGGMAPFAGSGQLTGGAEPRLRGRTWIIGLVALIAIIGSVLAVPRFLADGPLGPIADSSRVAVLVMRPVFDPADSLLANSANEAIISRLRDDRRVVLFTPEQLPLLGAGLGLDVVDITRDSLLDWMPDLGVHAHLTVTVARAGTGYVVSALVRAVAADSALLNAQQAAASAIDVPRVVEDLAGEAARALGRAYGRVARPQPTGALLRTTADAARLIRDGFNAGERREYLEAADKFRSAVRIDSTSAMAWYGLHVSLANAGVLTDERLRAIAAAFRFRERLPFRDARVLFEADYFRSIGDDERALAAYQRAEREFGQSGGDNNLGLLYQRQRRFDDAARAFERVRDTTYLTPWVANTNYVTALLDLRRDEEARAELQRLDSLAGPENGSSRSSRFSLLRYARQTDSIVLLANRHLETARTDGQKSTASQQLANALLVRGRYREAHRVAQERGERLAAAGASPTTLAIALGRARDLARLAGDTAAALRVITEALAVTPFASLPPMDRPYASAIGAYAAVGRIAEARRLSAEAEREIPAEFARVFAPGLAAERLEIELADGKPAKAMEQNRRADVGACVPCRFPDAARIWDALGNADSALVYLERYLEAKSSRMGATDAQSLAPAYRRAGELHEAKADVRKAIERYRQFVELWKDADPDLQPQVTEVKARIARLESRIG